MAGTINPQDIANAKIDIEDIGESVNEAKVITPRYGDSYKSIPLVSAEAEAKISEFQQAIDTIVIDDGVPAVVVSTASDQNQQEINDFGGYAKYKEGRIYAKNQYVMLDNGDVVKAVEDGLTTDPNVDMTGWVNHEKDQEDFNELVKTQSVNIKQFSNALTDFSLAYYNALEFCRLNNVETIYVPDGTYCSTNSVSYTLNKNIKMVFGTNVKIYQNSHNNLFDINQLGFTVEVDGNGVEIYPNWETAPSSEICALKFNGWTKKRNFTLSGVNVLKNPETSYGFTWAFHGVGLNYATINDSLLQAINSVYIASQLTTSTTPHAMGNEFLDVRCLADNIGVLVVNQGSLASEGFKFSGGEVLADVGFRVIDNISASYYSPLFSVNDTHINARLALDLNGISRVSIKADIQARVSSDNTANGLIELSGVQVFNFTGSNVSHAVRSGSAITDAKPIFHVKSHPNGKISAFFNLGSATYWLAAQNGKLISFESDSVYNGAIQLGCFPRGGFAGKIVDKDYIHRVSADESLSYTTPDIDSQLAFSTDATFSDGVLTLGKKPLLGGYYIIPSSVVPNDSTINQIVCNALRGKFIDILFESARITLSHTANFLQLNGSSWKTGGSRSGIRVYMVNQSTSHVVTTGGIGSHIPRTTVPTSTSQTGVHGQKIFSNGFVYEYIQGTGWVKYAAQTF